MSAGATIAAVIVAAAMARSGHAADTFLDRNHVQEAVPYGTTLDDEPKAEPEPGKQRREGTPAPSAAVPARPPRDGAPAKRSPVPAE